MGVTNHLLTGMILPEWHDEVYISTGGLSSQGFHTWKTPIVCLLNDGMVVLHPVVLPGGLEVPLANEHRSVYNIYIYMEPVNMLYFGTSTLQRKAQTPIKTGSFGFQVYTYIYIHTIRLIDTLRRAALDIANFLRRAVSYRPTPMPCQIMQMFVHQQHIYGQIIATSAHPTWCVSEGIPPQNVRTLQVLGKIVPFAQLLWFFTKNISSWESNGPILLGISLN